MPRAKKSLPGGTAAGYDSCLIALKDRIRSAQAKAAVAVNSELILLYWEIGKEIIERQNQFGWGKSIVERLAADLQREFPGSRGFSARNIWDMRRFYEYYSDKSGLRQLVAEIPWGHNLLLLNSLTDIEEVRWYIVQTIEYGWSRAVLAHQIDTDLYSRQARTVKLNNFAKTLKAPQSELLQQTIKDPYVFDFLDLGKEVKERELERALIDKIRDFLLELGSGFAFMGNQYHLEVDGDDFYIDLLFYHHQLRCLVAIDLKVEDFKPEFAGKMNFYLSALDDLVKHPDDQASVGIILCKGKKKTIGEYALRDVGKPIGVSAYRMTEKLPKRLQNSLPKIEELEAQLESIERDYEEST